jgi:hypothetical protein
VLIGKLLGPAKVGVNQHSEPSPAGEGSTHNDRHKFRIMAAHEELVEELLGPAEHGGDRRSEDFNSPAGELNEVPKDDRHKFRGPNDGKVELTQLSSPPRPWKG